MTNFFRSFARGGRHESGGCNAIDYGLGGKAMGCSPETRPVQRSKGRVRSWRGARAVVVLRL